MMAQITDRDRRFAAHLEELRDQHEGRAAMAALRRALGKALGEAPEAARYILPWLPSQLSESEERAYSLVACLFASHQIGWHAGAATKELRNFGASMRLLARATTSGGADRRFIAMLTSSLEDLPEHLRHAVNLLKSRSDPIPVDWPQLIADLRRWGDDSRRVQGEWARAFWGEAPPTTAAEEQSEENPESAN
jgi:CRISPR type I-E-associated protein CasB/Cse2